MNREKNTESRCSEPLEEDKEHLSAMEHIVFGSKVTISLAEQPNFILHSQGFIQEDVLIHNINCNANDSLSLLGHDPSNCIFDILPFNSLRNFRFQSKMQKGVRNLETLQKKIFSEDSIKKRSENLEDFKKKLWEEVGSNKNFLEKMRGTNVLYENSIFVLLHSNSLKFLTLNIEENEKSQYLLADFPSEQSFFKFIPSLKMQSQRSNTVYSNDSALICSAYRINNRFFYMTTDVETFRSPRSSRASSPERGSPKQQFKATEQVYATLDDSTRWKIRIFQKPQNEGKAKQVLVSGDVIHLPLSERSMGLIVHISEAETDQVPAVNPLILSNKNIPEMKMDEKMASSNLLSQKESDKFTCKVVFDETSYYSSAQSESTNGLWKVETQDPLNGDSIRWDTPVRLRHLTTGRYLRPSFGKNEDSGLELTFIKDSTTLFSFCSIATQKIEAVGSEIFLDSYFRIKAVSSNQWIHFPEESLGDQRSLFTPAMLKSGWKPIDTFKVKKADFEGVIETRFLIAAYPLLRKLSMQLSENKEGSGTLEELCLQGKDCLEMLEDFVMNRLPSSISNNQDFHSLCPSRQNIMRQLHIFPHVINIIFAAFPEPQMTPDNLFHIQGGLRLALGQNSSIIDSEEIDLAAMKRRKEERQSKKRAKRNRKLCKQAYSFISTVCRDNQRNQDFFLPALKIMQEHLGRKKFVLPALLEILKGNDKVKRLYRMPVAPTDFSRKISYQIAEFEKNKEKLGNNKGRSPNSLEDSNGKITLLTKIIFSMLLFKRYTTTEIIRLLINICECRQGLVFRNQTKILSILRIPIIQKRCLMRTSVREDRKGLLIHFEEDHYERNNFLANGNMDNPWNEMNEFANESINDEKSDRVLKVDFKPHTDYQKTPMESEPNLGDTKGLQRAKGEGEFFFKDSYMLEKSALRSGLEISSERGEGQDIQEFFKNGRELHKEFYETQLNLYAALVSNRNFQARKELVKLFPMELLIHYAIKQQFDNPTSEALPINIRATFVKLLARIYIDQKPRTPITKPNFIRVVRLREDTKDRIREPRRIEELGSGNVESDSSEDKNILNLEKDLLKIIKRTSEKVKDLMRLTEYNKEKVEEVYNGYTLEVLKTTLMLLRFGYFINESQDSEQKENKWTKQGKAVFDSLNNLVKHLVLILEFDPQYWAALRAGSIYFKYESRTEDKVLMKTFSGVKTVIGGVSNFVNVLSGTIGKTGKQQERRSKNQEMFQELKVIQDPFLAKSLRLRKILDKFSGKLVNPIEESELKSNETEIKIIICDIFSFLLDLREDFHISNVVEFYRRSFKKIFDKNQQKEKFLEKDFFYLFKKILPFHTVSTNFKQQYYEKGPHMQFFDDIIKRSFTQSLLLAFYFAKSPKLQSCLLALLEKHSTQASKLTQNLKNVELIISSHQISLYKTILNLKNDIKNLIFESQVWLQTIYIENNDSDYEEQMAKVLKKLKALLAVFSKHRKQTMPIKNMNDLSDMKSDKGPILDPFFNPDASIKGLSGSKRNEAKMKEDDDYSFDQADPKLVQRIFRHIEGENIMISFLRESISISKEMDKIFRGDSDIEKSYSLKVFKCIADIHVLVFKILTSFVHTVKKNQKLLFQELDLFMSNFTINFGQTSLIVEIFRENKSFCIHMPQSVIKYFMKLIKMHGHCPQFLEIFEVMSQCADSGNIGEIRKSILYTFTLEEYQADLNPLLERKPLEEKESHLRFPMLSFERWQNPKEYQNKFFKVLSLSLEQDIPLNFLSKMFTSYSIKSLLDLINQSEESPNAPENLQLKRSVMKLLLIYNSKFSTPVLEALFRHYKDVCSLLYNEARCFHTLKSSENPELLKYLGEDLANYCCDIFDLFSIYKNDPLHSHEAEEAMEATTNFMSEFEKKLGEFFVGSISTAQKTTLKRLINTFRLSPPEYASNFFLEEGGDEEIITEEEMSRSNLTSANFGSNMYHLSDIHRKRSLNSSDLRSLNKKTTIDSHFTHNESKMMSSEKFSWFFLVKRLNRDKKVADYIKTERYVLAKMIIEFENEFIVAKKSSTKVVVSSLDILEKSLEYISSWELKKGSKENVIFLLLVMCSIIKSFLKVNLNIQKSMDVLGATQIAIRLIWEEKMSDPAYLVPLFKFCNLMLQGGNKDVQRSLFNIFLMNPLSQMFFKKIHKLLHKEAKGTDTMKSMQTGSGDNGKLILKLLKMLQLFCEGHNNDLQEYLHHQKNSKVQYNIVQAVVRLLTSYRINPKTYETVLQVFDTLTEFVQGPCKPNQLEISNSQFLEFSVSLLKGESKVIDYMGGKKPRNDQSMFRSFSKSSSFKISAISQYQSSASKHRSQLRKENMLIAVYQFNRLKSKCLITLLSLLENLNLQEDILFRMVRTIPLKVLKDNLIDIHMTYKKLYRKNEYKIDIFNRANEEVNPKNKKFPLYYELIFENGVNAFILMKHFVKVTNEKAGASQNDSDIEELMDKKFKQLPPWQRGVIGEFIKFLYAFAKSIKQLLSDINHYAFKHCKKKSREGFFQIAEDKIKKSKAYSKNLRAAVKFFHSKIIQIDIIRDENLERVYFPVMPFCNGLSKSYKKEFHSKVDRSSDKAKLSFLIKESEKLIKTMRHEYALNLRLNSIYLFGFVFSHISLLENLIFILAIIINLMILFSWSDDEESIQIRIVIDLIGYICLSLIGLVTIYHLLRRGPIILSSVSAQFLEQKKDVDFVNKFILFLISVVRGVYALCLEEDILFLFGQIGFGILALIFHSFFWAYHLTDILRNEILRNIVNAVWIRKIPLILTFLVFILIEYYFTLIAYLAFWDHYLNERCNSLAVCFLTTFDQTFKNTGAIGAYLEDPNAEDGEINYGRFVFDHAFNILLVLVLLNMVAGIIIDEFGALKDKLTEKEDDMKQVCFICGIKRAVIEKSSDLREGFKKHIKRDHYMWNYIFYRSYLTFKDPNEYTGTESYVFNKIQSFDLSWFPIKRSFGVETEQEEGIEKAQILEELYKKVPYDFHLKLKNTWSCFFMYFCASMVFQKKQMSFIKNNLEAVWENVLKLQEGEKI